MIMKSIKVYWSNDQKGNYIKFHGGVRTDMRIFPSLFKFLEKKLNAHNYLTWRISTLLANTAYRTQRNAWSVKDKTKTEYTYDTIRYTCTNVHKGK